MLTDEDWDSKLAQLKDVQTSIKLNQETITQYEEYVRDRKKILGELLTKKYFLVSQLSEFLRNPEYLELTEEN